MGVQIFYCKGPHVLLWAGFLCAVRGKIKINGIPYFKLYMIMRFL